jgi:hypothetical protein
MLESLPGGNADPNGERLANYLDAEPIVTLATRVMN